MYPAFCHLQCIQVVKLGGKEGLITYRTCDQILKVPLHLYEIGDSLLSAPGEDKILDPHRLVTASVWIKHWIKRPSRCRTKAECVAH